MNLSSPCREEVAHHPLWPRLSAADYEASFRLNGGLEKMRQHLLMGGC
ncbi:MAG: hypothetical protein Q8L62_12210 [Candidatus Nitrotoga sp.]|nr:hypothetical protein [Candidatus Nitrotoga sp.]